jgi:hypothetical protein
MGDSQWVFLVMSLVVLIMLGAATPRVVDWLEKLRTLQILLTMTTNKTILMMMMIGDEKQKPTTVHGETMSRHLILLRMSINVLVFLLKGDGWRYIFFAIYTCVSMQSTGLSS